MTATTRQYSRRFRVGCLVLGGLLLLTLCILPSFFLYRAIFPPTGPATSEAPHQIRELQGVTAVAAGNGFSLALKNNGTVWAWGAGYLGQLGTPADDTCKATFSSDCQRTPTQVPLPRKATDIAAAGDHAAALADDGSVWVWGSDQYNGLGDSVGPTATYTTFMQTTAQISYRMKPESLVRLQNVTALAANEHQFVALTNQGEVWTWGEFERTPRRVALTGQATEIAASGTRSAALTTDGAIWEWTPNVRPNPTSSTQPNVTALALGADYTLTITSDGAAWFRGNGYGPNLCQVQYGTWNGNLRCTDTPAKVSELPSLTAAVSTTRYQAALLVLATDGQLWTWDNGRTTDPGGTSPGTITARRLNFGNARALAAGRDHELILRTDGTVWGRGDNSYGQIGR